MASLSSLGELISTTSLWNNKLLPKDIERNSSLAVTDVKPAQDPFRRFSDSQRRRHNFEQHPPCHQECAFRKQSHQSKVERVVENTHTKNAKGSCVSCLGSNNGYQMEDVWTDFGKETSCHGIKCIDDRRRSRCIRFVWIVIVLGMAFFLIINIVHLLLEYRKYHTVTRSDVRIQEKPIFPSVTVCNICPLKNNDGDLDSVINRISAQTTAFRGYFPLNMSDPEMQRLMNTSTRDVREFYTYKREEMLLFGQYEGKFINITEDFEVTDTPYGRCYTFNGPEYIWRNGIRRVNFDGRYSGLRVFIKVDQKRYTIYEDLTAGVRIFLTHHPDTPLVHREGLEFHPGTSTAVALSSIEYRFLPHPFASYGSEYCMDSDEKDLRDKMLAGHFYSRNLCLDQCHNLEATKICSCYGHMLRDRPWWFPPCDNLGKPCPVKGVEGLPPCTLHQDLFCHTPVLEAILKGNLNVTCDCPRLCTFTRYDTVMSASQMPSTVSSEFIMKRVNETTVQSLRENFVELRVYMASMLSRHECHEPQYTLNSIFAYLGGQMGFFLGASLITLTELAEAIFYSLWYLIRWKLPSCGKMKSSSSLSN